MSAERPGRLVRRLGLAGVLFLTLSVTTPASSLFVIVPGMLHVAGTGTLLALLIAAIVCIATAYIYAELSSAWPSAGGEYVMVAHTLGPAAAFVMLGVNVFNNLLFPPVAALGLSAILAAVVPDLPAVPTAVLVLSIATLIALLNIRLNAWLTGLFLLIEVATLGAVAIVGFAHARVPLGSIITHPLMPAAGRLEPSSLASLGIATTIAIFALNGYGVAVYFGEEMHEAPKRIARAVLLALWAALLLEVVPVAAALAGSPDLHSLATSDDPFGLVVRTLGGPELGRLVSLGVAIAIVNAVIAAILATARFFYGTGRDGSWGSPGDKWMSAIHPRYQSPWIATLLVGGVGIACCFLPLEFLLVLSGAGLIVIYAGIALAAIAGRGSGASAHAPFRMPYYPLWPVLTLGALAYVSWTNWLDPAEGRPALVATGGEIVVSLLYYYLVLRRRGTWTVHWPD